MESYKFTIIIPNYNNAKWLNRMFESICAQTYKNYEVAFVDDCSTDESLRIAEKWGRMVGDFYLVKNKTKRWNGGSRNAAMRFSAGEYTLFMDSDDWFADNDCLAAIAEALEEKGSPDLLRLSYYSLIGEELNLADLGGQNTVASIVHDPNVACWTKCVKTKKLVKFPENTLMEDVTQHIAQLDNVETVAAMDKGIIVCLQGGKWKSSLYRYYADLLELEVKNPECQAELEHRRAVALDNIKNDRFVQ